MAFEWKSISEGSGEFGGGEPASTTAQRGEPASPDAHRADPTSVQPVAVQLDQAQSPIDAVPAVQEVPAVPVASATPAVDPDMELPMCDVHNAVVNSMEKSGYNESYDAEVYSSYDTGVNADENAVVA